jgi:hypothetical protein
MGTTYQDVLQAIRDGENKEAVEAMLVDERVQLTDVQIADLRAVMARKGRNASVTDREISGLLDEAVRAGDDKQVRLCQVALTGFDTLDGGREVSVTDTEQAQARAACVTAILDAEAQS